MACPKSDWRAQTVSFFVNRIIKIKKIEKAISEYVAGLMKLTEHASSEEFNDTLREIQNEAIQPATELSWLDPFCATNWFNNEDNC